MQTENAGQENQVNLVHLEGTTLIHIDVEINAEGNLVLAGQDIGDAPQSAFGDSEYEYWLEIKAADKDRLLLALIEKIYAGNARVISQLREYLDSKNIPCRLTTY